MEATKEHLEPVQNSRGFSLLPPIEGNYGGHVALRESSSAEEPMIWLDVEEPNDLNDWARGDRSGGTHCATLHLTAEDAWKLKEQIEYILEHHYHGDARPI